MSLLRAIVSGALASLIGSSAIVAATNEPALAPAKHHLTAWQGAAPMPGERYGLIVVDLAGDAWEIDYNLTADDCRAAAIDRWFESGERGFLYCRVERPA